MKGIVDISQSNVVRKRARKLKYKWIDNAKIGKCSLCKRDNIKIRNEKYSLCLRCHRWCKKYLRRKFGYVHWSKFIEAIEYFVQPIKCQFYAYCGNTTSRLKENGEIRGDGKTWVCSDCYPMWEAGFRSGKRHIKDTVKKGRSIIDGFNK